jgi:release factor glutamine methyltransferase
MTLTIAELYQSMKEQLSPVVDSAAQATAEADLILQELLQLSSAQVFSVGEQTLSEAETARITNLLDQRIGKRIPLQYLLHQAWFYGRRFYVNPAVLIPRPETELLVEQAQARLNPGMSVLDIGVGSGAIAISLSLALGESVRVVGVELSETALKVARINQRMLGSTVAFKPAGNLFEPLMQDDPVERFDVIVSNPPYIDSALKATLMPEVLWHEPQEALFPPDDDAYMYYRLIARQSRDFLKPNGQVMVEIGAGMAPTVTQLFLAAGFTQVKSIRDYAQIERIVVAML